MTRSKEMSIIEVGGKGFEVEVVGGMPMLSSKEVAEGYGVPEKTIQNHSSNHADELIEGTHFHTVKTAKNTPRKLWTIDGIIRLGFFIKSGNARRMRDLAQELTSRYLTGKTQSTETPLHGYPLQRENIELKRAINRMLENQREVQRLNYLDASNYNDLLDAVGKLNRAAAKAEEAMREVRGYHESAISFLDRINERLQKPQRSLLWQQQ
jgi:hypothetical protein